MNDVLDRVRLARASDPVAREALPTLRRDPVTGDYRLM